MNKRNIRNWILTVLGLNLVKQKELLFEFFFNPGFKSGEALGVAFETHEVHKVAAVVVIGLCGLANVLAWLFNGLHHT